MTKKTCIVQSVVFYNEDNGYAVLKCMDKNGMRIFYAVGNVPEVDVKSEFEFEGKWENSDYGKQFRISQAKELLPSTIAGIRRYLGSGFIKGIGPATADNIIKKFSNRTLEIMDKDPDRLLEVPGIGEKRLEQIKESWKVQKNVQDVMLFLQGHGISPAYSVRIYKKYGKNSISIVSKNPYQLADDIDGIGFKVADKIAEGFSIPKNSFVRIRSGILYQLNTESQSGHCFLPREELLKEAAKLLELKTEYVDAAMNQLIESKDIIEEDGNVYLRYLYSAETGCAAGIKKLVRYASNHQSDLCTGFCFSNKSGTKYNEMQRKAIETAAAGGIMVLTGGPGTGKTTTTKGIIEVFRSQGKTIALAAPTGRAAKRLSEATGMEAKTIHRLLEYSRLDGKFMKNESNPIYEDVVIVDECSMIDIILMYSLIRAITPGTSVVLIGDVDQLPSVGPGNVLKNIIDSGAVPVIKLTEIFRQAQGSHIIMNAHRVNNGQKLDFDNSSDSDFFFQKADSDETIAELITRLYENNLPKYYHVDPKTDIQILTPMKKGPCGTLSLNKKIQERVNPCGPEISAFGINYRKNDKVMQIRNNYEKNVFNGDVGYIKTVDEIEKTLTVNFDGREVQYDRLELDDLILAYASTIHKSQGSEYKIVVMPVTTGHYIMLQRNLLYTGITRAKDVIVLVGSKKAIYTAVHNDKAKKRYTMLAKRLEN